MTPPDPPPTARVVLSWSSGKDSAWTLQRLRAQGAEVVALLSTVNQVFARVAMHGTRTELVQAQARAAGVPLIKVLLPWPCPNEAYEAALGEALIALRDTQGVTQVAFGDLFLEEVRAYRERLLASLGLQGVFPLWGMPSAPLAREMIAAGVEAWIVCLDPKRLPSEWAGARVDARFLERLPAGVDPCGENGEFHTAVTAGPMFSTRIPVRAGEVVERDGFVFADLLLEEAPP